MNKKSLFDLKNQFDLKFFGLIIIIKYISVLYRFNTTFRLHIAGCYNEILLIYKIIKTLYGEKIIYIY